MTAADIVEACRALYDDLDFSAARDWKAEKDGRRCVGYLPVHVPRELVHAAGMLPVGILGAGERLEVIQGDAYFQSYICHFPRSAIELALTGRLDFLDGMLFPGTCDVIRNMSGMWRALFPDMFVRYLETPQNYDPGLGGAFYRRELDALKAALEDLSGNRITDDGLLSSIAVHDENRRLMRALYGFRSDFPWKAPAADVYLVARAGMVLPVADHSKLVGDYLKAAEAEDRPMRDNCRVVIQGGFCEQPPLDLIKTVELAGCWIVDDDLVLATRWFGADVGGGGDPMDALVRAGLRGAVETAARYQPEGAAKGGGLLRAVEERAAEGVIFASPSFCDPALLDRPMQARALDRAGVPHMSFKYAENSAQTQPIREQAGTFADSVKLWGEA